MAKQKRDAKKGANNAAAKKKPKKADVIDMENAVNAIKLQQMKSFDETQKPPTTNDKKKKKEKNDVKKQPLPEMNDVKIQVSLFSLLQITYRQR